MGAKNIALSDKQATIYLPQYIDKPYAANFIKNLPHFEDDQFLTLDFTKTVDIDGSFYSKVSELDKLLSSKGLKFESVFLSKDLKNLLVQEGVYSFFHHNIEKKPSQGKKLRVEFVQPFVDSTVEVLQVQAQTPVEAQPIRVKAADESIDFNIMGILSIVSKQFEGSISLCFPEKVFLAICSNMLGEPYEEINDEVQDAAGEILNIIFGMSKAKLNNEYGYVIEKAIPTVIKGDSIKIKQTLGPTIILPFQCEAGSFHLEIEISDQ